MLVEFSLGNYKSFKDVHTFSMVASKKDSSNSDLNENSSFEAPDGKQRLLKTAAIYGANASGKTTLLEGIGYFNHLILHSFASPSLQDIVFRFDTASLGKPTFFQAVFYLDGKKYRYGYTFNSEKIIDEWLIVHREKEVKLFSRENTFDIKVNKKEFKEAVGFEKNARENALFLSLLGALNGTVSKRLLQYFWTNLQYVTGLSGLADYSHVTKEMIGNKAYHSKIVNFLRIGDKSIDDIGLFQNFINEDLMGKEPYNQVKERVEQMKDRVASFHKGYRDNEEAEGIILDFATYASAGTKKLFSFAGLLVEVLTLGAVVFIDELDNSLHPILTRHIIQVFNSKMSNPNNAQLIFTTHDTNLLRPEILRRDQIWFTEKDQFQATDLYSLADFKGVREEVYEDNYIKGKYGAIPFVGDFLTLLEDGEADKKD